MLRFLSRTLILTVEIYRATPAAEIIHVTRRKVSGRRRSSSRPRRSYILAGFECGRLLGHRVFRIRDSASADPCSRVEGAPSEFLGAYTPGLAYLFPEHAECRAIFPGKMEEMRMTSYRLVRFNWGIIVAGLPCRMLLHSMVSLIMI